MTKLCNFFPGMGKRTRADSARKSNLVKALEKKRRINDGNKENVSTYITDRNTNCNGPGRILDDHPAHNFIASESNVALNTPNAIRDNGKQNVLKALDAVPLTSMRKCVIKIHFKCRFSYCNS